jgi:hypothetical protein
LQDALRRLSLGHQAPGVNLSKSYYAPAAEKKRVLLISNNLTAACKWLLVQPFASVLISAASAGNQKTDTGWQGNNRVVAAAGKAGRVERVLFQCN